jgi:hypothetical protein
MDWLVPVFKVALSGLARMAGDIDEARERIYAAKEWVKTSSNKLFEVDVGLEQARVHLLANEPEEARECVAEAESTAKKIGYCCRLAEISRVIRLCE